MMGDQARGQRALAGFAPLVLGAVLAAALLVIVVLWWDLWMGLAADPTAKIQALVQSAGPYGPLLYIAIQAMQVVVAPIPGSTVSWAGGYLFGLLPAILYTTVGNAVGSLFALLIARTMGRPILERLVGERQLRRIDRFSRGRGPVFFFAVFLLPFLPDDLICFAAGLTAIPILTLLWISIVGRLPGIVVASYIGASIARVDWVYFLPLGAVALVAGLLYLRYQRTIRALLLRWLRRLR